MKLRDYQEKAVADTMAAIHAGHFGANGGPLLNLATGSGKTIVQAGLCLEILKQFPNIQILIVTAFPELVEQTEQALLEVFPEMKVGVFCAQLGRKQTKQITVATIGSVARQKELFTNYAAILCDETHVGLKDSLEIQKGVRSLMRKNESISEEDAEHLAKGQMRRFLDWHLTAQPRRALVGLSGTPERFGNISLVGTIEECQTGKFLYSVTSAEITTEYLIEQGWLKPISTFIPRGQVDLSDVKIERGEYDVEELGSKFCAMENASIHVETLAKFAPIQPKHGQILITCVNVAHIHKVTELANAHPVMQACGFKTMALTHLTPLKERRQILNDFKNGRIKCLCFGSILQVGFDMNNRETNHEISMILGLCPTKSSVRYRQREIGRSVRPFYARDPDNPFQLDERFDLSTQEGRLSSIAASPITHCLYVSFDRNPIEHSAISEELAKSGELKDGKMPKKECPKCAGKVPISTLVCHQQYDYDLELDGGQVLKAGEVCGFQFPEVIRANEKELYSGGVRGLEGSAIDPNVKLGILHANVEGVIYAQHTSKANNLSLKVTYVYSANKKLHEIHEYIPMSQSGRFIANRWWGQVMPNCGACPFSIEEILECEGEFRAPVSIKIRKGGKGKGFPEILEKFYAEEVAVVDDDF